MKELLLLRHAQAEDGGPGRTDFGRPLTARGEEDAARVGRLLAERGLRPDLVVTSPARRALATAGLAARELGIPASALVEDPRIYEAGPLVLAELAAQALRDHQRPMLVGHNPGFEHLAIRFGAPASGWEFPKGGAARFQVTDLEAVRQAGGCRFVELLAP